MALRLRRGSDNDRQLITPLQGELIYTTDTKKLYVGDGATQGGVLVGPDDASTYDLVNDTTPQLGGNLDLNTHNITGSGNININGTITATGNINLGDGSEDNVIVGGSIGSSLIPDTDNSYQLGLGNVRWASVHATDIFAGGEVHTEDLYIKEFIHKADTSSVLYRSDTDTLFVAAVEGDIYGSLYDEDSGVIVDNINRNINIDNITVSEDLTTSFIKTSTSNINIASTVVDITNGTSDSKLRVTGTDPFSGVLEVDNFNSDGSGFGGTIAMGRGRGTTTNRQLLQDGDNIFNLAFLALRTGGSDNTSGISTYVEGTPTAGTCPADLQFYTTNAGGNTATRVKITSAGILTVEFGLATSLEDLADAAAISLLHPTSYFTTAAAETATLADGVEGQMKILVAEDVTAGDMVVTVASAGWGGSGEITFSTNASGCTLQFVNGAWYCIGNNGAAFA